MFSKPRSGPAEWLDHIVVETDLLTKELGQPPNPDRLDDPLIWRGVERCFAIIAEAVARLHRAGVELSSLEPAVDWRGWRRFGDYLRHEYDRLDAGIIQHTLVSEIGPLHAAALRLKSRFGAEQS